MGDRTNLRWRSIPATERACSAARTTTAAFTTRTTPTGTRSQSGPIWLGYYRSENAGASFVSSLVPGYPDDASPYGAIAKRQVRTASSGDPVIAWDAQGRAFFGSESSDDPAGTPKTFGDAWVATFDNPGGPTGDTQNDGKRYRGTVVVARGSSAPNLLGKFNDKTAIEADHNADGRCDNDVYFACSRFTGKAGGVGDLLLALDEPRRRRSASVEGLADDLRRAVPGHRGDREQQRLRRLPQLRVGPRLGGRLDLLRAVDRLRRDVHSPAAAAGFIPYDAQDCATPRRRRRSRGRTTRPGEEEPAEAGDARDCGDFDAHCESGYTFFRRDTQVGRPPTSSTPRIPTASTSSTTPRSPGPKRPPGRHTGRPSPASAARPGSSSSGSTAQRDEDGPSLIDAQPIGHQIFPDISADNPSASSRGTLHTIWWDSRNDRCYSPTRPIGNCANRRTVPSLDAWGARSRRTTGRLGADPAQRHTSNPNYEQFADRTVPFAGDYLYVSSVNDFAFGVWTDWRNTVQGTDPREDPEDEDGATADVHPVPRLRRRGVERRPLPARRGLDQNIYGDLAP